MVSKRNFFSIAIMMFVLLFLFQFSMVVRDSQNTYDINSDLTARSSDGENAWQKEQIDLTSLAETDRKYVLFVGDASGEMARAADRWCTYAKWNLATCSSMDEVQEQSETLPGMLILESEKYANGSNPKKLEKMVQNNVIIVWLSGGSGND